jgi:hypothetical protein
MLTSSIFFSTAYPIPLFFALLLMVAVCAAKMSGSGRASKSGLGYEVEKKMEQVRSMTHDQLNVLFRIIFFNH